MEEQNLIVTPAMRQSLKEIANWGRFLSIVGFIFTGFIFVAAFAMIGMGSALPQEVMGGIGGGVLSVFYFFIGILYLIPTYYLFRFASHTRRALATDDQEYLALAFGNLRHIFVFFGVVTALGLVVYVLSIFAIAAGGIIGGL